jgi:hypothetical protein
MRRAVVVQVEGAKDQEEDGGSRNDLLSCRDSPEGVERAVQGHPLRAISSPNAALGPKSNSVRPPEATRGFLPTTAFALFSDAQHATTRIKMVDPRLFLP